ncbi:MAG: 3-dehydroquinate synthase [Ignavibacteriaceae bacterium]
MFLIVDANVRKLHHSKFKSAGWLSGKKVPEFVLAPGEKSKSVETFDEITNFLKTNKAKKNSALISIGGGVTCDIAGFVASVYMRGISLVHIPTTLLSCTDSSIGGKTALNFREVKNLIGSYYHPEFVLIDPLFLNTLPQKELLNGAGEVLKYALLSDEKFFRFIKRNFRALITPDPEILNKTIRHCIGFKASVVMKDEKDSGLRKILNLGHTFAHGIEAASEFRINHGAAVTAGLICSIYLSSLKHFIDETRRDDLLTLFDQVPVESDLLNLNSGNIFNFMLFDKKRSSRKPEFILPLKAGEVIIGAEAEKREIKDSVDLMKLFISERL